ncbi:hypothetical protein F5Y12DRAFT_364773 [Xylaria sp. FL1777]|nr:hypothetical protein F5Y12DRAFT_364773 [Xylaria sp. FL1777]
MGLPSETHSLPRSDALNLHLDHPTEDELVKISTNTFASWGDSLDLPKYLEESRFLTRIPLARDGGMTTWILVDRTLPPNQRPILCSCETFHKRSLTSDSNGNVSEAIIHGIASVFCPEEYRGRGYAARHMKELAKDLRNWQSGSHQAKVAGSILYSDIGKVYYANLGWIPNATNSDVEFQAMRVSRSPLVQDITESELSEFCMRDQVMIRKAIATPAPGVQQRLVILPDLDHMLWHIRKADFATNYLFNKTPLAKGAIAGPPGKQVWAIWTHRYYARHDAENPDNVLYILRLVVEGDPTANQPRSVNAKQQVSLPSDQVSYLEAVLQAAQAEAAEWQLDHVELWEPSPCVQHAILDGKIRHTVVERQRDSVASGLWIDEDGHAGRPLEWINNERYAWC